MRIVVVALTAIMVAGCGLLGGTKIEVPIEDKDFVTDAKAALTNIKAEYVFAKGMVSVVNQKVDEFLYIEDGLKLGRVKWKTFQTELADCWQTPFSAVENVKARTVNVIDAARNLKNNTALHEAKSVRDTAYNAVAKVQACPQALADQVKGLPKRATDEAKAWAQGKMQILNEVRVIVRKDLPSRVKALPGKVVDDVTVIGKQLASAKAWQTTIEKAGNEAAKNKNLRQIKTLEGLKAEATSLQTTITSDAATLGTQVQEATRRIATGINNFKK